MVYALGVTKLSLNVSILLLQLRDNQVSHSKSWVNLCLLHFLIIIHKPLNVHFYKLYIVESDHFNFFYLTSAKDSKNHINISLGPSSIALIFVVYSPLSLFVEKAPSKALYI